MATELMNRFFANADDLDAFAKRIRAIADEIEKRDGAFDKYALDLNEVADKIERDGEIWRDAARAAAE